MSQIFETFKREHIVDQLKKYGFVETKKLTYKELVNKLSLLHAIKE